MHPVLRQNLFFVREHVGLLKAANEFDVFDPTTGRKVLECREPRLGGLTKALRFTDSRRKTPFEIVIRTPEGAPVLVVKRGVALFLSKVQVLDEHGRHVGGFHQKLFSFGGKFEVLDASGAPVCTLQGKFTGWEFRFFSPAKDYAVVTKKWAGAGKELFTSADDYILQIKDAVDPDDPTRMLILAAVMVIDMVLKE
jgi:uncharacterized protein YxjI